MEEIDISAILEEERRAEQLIDQARRRAKEILDRARKEANEILRCAQSLEGDPRLEEILERERKQAEAELRELNDQYKRALEELRKLLERDYPRIVKRILSSLIGESFE